MKMKTRFFGVVAIAVVAVGLGSAPALAQATLIEIPLDTVVGGAPDSEHLLETAPVTPADVGKNCSVVVEGENNESAHPDTDLLVRSGTSEVVASDVEREPNVITEATGTLVLGSEVSVFVRLGPDGVFSGGLVVTATCVPPPPAEDGCTPGFWKQPHHFDSWVGHAPTDSFDTVFDVDVTLRAGGRQTVADPTLLDALKATGGGVNALARHAVAALLNASNPDVDFEFTEQEVIDMVHDAIASGDLETTKDLLATANQRGCPLS